MKTMKYFNLVITMAIMSLLYGCYPKGPDGYDDAEFDIALSKYDPSFPGDDLGTIFIPDTLSYFNNNSYADMPEGFPEDEIIDKINSNIDALGFEIISNEDSAKYIMRIAFNSAEICGSYWYPYDPLWWYVGFPPYFPPWGGGVYCFNAGSLYIYISDRAENKLVYYGLVDGPNGDFNELRLMNGIDQLFKQAPFN